MLDLSEKEIITFKFENDPKFALGIQDIIFYSLLVSFLSIYFWNIEKNYSILGFLSLIAATIFFLLDNLPEKIILDINKNDKNVLIKKESFFEKRPKQISFEEIKNICIKESYVLETPNILRTNPKYNATNINFFMMNGESVTLYWHIGKVMEKDKLVVKELKKYLNL